jgi:hypothetical protein
MENVARDENYLFRRILPCTAIKIIHNNMRLRINTREDYKMYTRRKRNIWWSKEWLKLIKRLSVFILYRKANSLNYRLLSIVKPRVKVINPFKD